MKSPPYCNDLQATSLIRSLQTDITNPDLNVNKKKKVKNIDMKSQDLNENSIEHVIDPLKMKLQDNTLKHFSLFNRIDVKFLLFTNSKHWIKRAKKYHIEYSTNFTTNEYGTPFFFPMLEYIESHYISSFYGFLNGDILLHGNIVNILDTVLQDIQTGKLYPQIMITGRRNNKEIDITDNIGTTNEEINQFIQQSVYKNEQFIPVSQDYFIFTKGTFDYPNMFPVVIGRNDYDNYLVDYCYHRNDSISLIDGSNAIIALHQTESHGNFAGERVNPDKKWNHLLIGKHHEYDSVLFANWRLYTTTDNHNYLIHASPFDDNYTDRELQFLQSHIPDTSCIFIYYIFIYLYIYIFTSVSRLATPAYA
ncbi:hypothetical protein WA158_002834 [Blastocystis sp. Blastoise]